MPLKHVEQPLCMIMANINKLDLAFVIGRILYRFPYQFLISFLCRRKRRPTLVAPVFGNNCLSIGLIGRLGVRFQVVLHPSITGMKAQALLFLDGRDGFSPPITPHDAGQVAGFM